MTFLFALAAVCLCLTVPSAVAQRSTGVSSIDGYGSTLAANDDVIVESRPSQLAFFLRLAPYQFSLSCTLPYELPTHNVYSVAVARQPPADDSVRFAFLGSDTKTQVPFIGSLTYTGVSGQDFVANTSMTSKTIFPCDGWQTRNYHMHSFADFLTPDGSVASHNDPMALALEYVDCLSHL